MLNRPTAQAESQDLSRGLEVKATRRPWNPALHPRDSKGRFIETGGVVRTWGGKLARVIRALPHDRILVQDQSGPNEFRGRRHTTSAKWVSMVARPDGSAPTDDEGKVAEEDERRTKDARRGNGVVRDDDGDPDTPNDPHDQDDRGRPIGGDDGDGPDDDDDQDEPEDGQHPVNVDALPNQQHAAGARHKDTAAVRGHFTQLAVQPGTSDGMATFLRSVAYDDDLQTTPSGRLAILRDERNGRFYLTATGTGQRVDAAGDFDTAQDAARFAEHLDETAVNGQITKFNQPFDFSDPQADAAARGWRSTKGENIQGAIQRARQEFDGTSPTPATAPKRSTPRTEGDAPEAGGQRFSTMQAVRAHWQVGLEHARRQAGGSVRMQRAAENLDALIKNDRLKLVGRGQFVVGQDHNGEWFLIATGTAAKVRHRWTSQRDAQAFAESFAENPPMGDDGNPLDLSNPKTSLQKWRSDDNRSIHEVLEAAAAKFQSENTTAGDTDEPDIPPYARAQPPAPSPEAAPEAPEKPQTAALPEGAEPVEGVDGYHYTEADGTVTIYGPDGQVAATSEYGYPPKTTIDGVTVPIPRYAPQRAAVMARLHLAANEPGKRDRVTAAWVMKPGKNGGPAKRVMVFRGTIKGDDRDYSAIGNVPAMKWAPSLGGYSTQSNMTEGKRDERITEVLAKLNRQGRNVHIVDETGAGTPNAPANAVDETEALRKTIAEANDDRLQHMKNELLTASYRSRSEATRRRKQADADLVDEELKRRRQERDEAAARDATSLSDDDIEARIAESKRELGTYGARRGEDHNDVERAVYSERRRRSQALVDEDTDLTTMAEDDLAKARETFAERVRMHQAAGDDHEAERNMRQALQARHDAVMGEQQRRRAEQIADRPQVSDLTDEKLAEEYNDLARRDFRKAPPEAQQILEGRLEDIKRERRERQKRAITDREAPENLSAEDLTAEYIELRRAPSSYNETDDVKEARKERMAALEAEQNRRDTTPEVAQLLARVDNPDDNGMISVDGRNGYGYVDFRSQSFGNRPSPLGWTWGKTSYSHGDTTYTSRAAALEALVRSYDNDPDTRGERTWGPARRVFVPKMFVELYQSSRMKDRLDGASQERQYLYHLFRDRYGWDDGVNPLIPSGKKGHNVKGRNLYVPEGLLAEFNRVTEELSREMQIRSTDRDADSSDRSKAKTRLNAINQALHAIATHREQVRNNGGNDDQKVMSREEAEAQRAALREALGGDDEHVQPDRSRALGDVPAQGVGGDGRSGGVREDEGQGDRDADSGGRGGAGEDGAGADGVRGSGRPAQAGQGGRNGDGPGGASARAGAGGGEGAGADADGAAPAGDQGPDVRRVARFRPDPAATPKTNRARAAANVEAIRVLKTLQAENRPATDEEKRILARWSGWGSVPIIFANEPNAKEPRYQQGGTREGKFEKDHERWSEYSDIRSELQRVLTPVEFRQASRGVLSMHYTPQPIAEAMWEGLRSFGFDRGDVLEAGSGAGTFFGVAPDGARLTGVELDPTTARIAQAIYPHANVLNESFAETDARPGTFDAAIGNVPFAQIPFDDKRYPAENLHNGFITKEIALVRPGGITAVITSRQTLDSKGDKARRKMAQYGDLLGAVRLPSGVFNDAGTGVTTDVLVFRRREDGTEPADTSWLDAPERDINGTPHHINAYFDEHPEHILGTLTTASTQYGPQPTVKGDPAKAAEQLRAALDDIATKAKADGRGYEPHPDRDDRPPVQLQTAREKHANDWTGRLYEGDDGQFYQHVNGADPVPLEPGDGNTDQLRDLVQLRDVAAELRELDRKNDEEERAEALRAQLRNLHAAYVENYGPLSKPGQHRTKGGVPTAWGYFRADPDAAAVLALERWDAKTGEPVLSRIFTERAAARRQPLSSTSDPKAALAAVVAAKGEVDLAEVARLLEVDEPEALKRLGTEVFTDPESSRLELASAYLSGAVRDKLDAARKAAEKDPAYAVNVAALEAVQPPDRTIGQFTPEMGAHWTPPELLQGFLREYLGDRTLRVSHDDRYGWILNTGRVPEANNLMYGVPANPEKGTRGKNAVEIARAILGFGSLTVYEDDKRKEVDEATSRLIRQKADQMRAEYAKYATANAERLSVLTDSYNRIMNGHVVRSYEGMSPTLEGFTPDRNPHPWQRSGAARMQFERGVILAHEVGLGKTSTLVMGTQALKASGQIDKPMAVVPNHLARQWYNEARFLYPNADIHLITSADLAGDRRGSTLEWLRANKPDLVIFTEEAFGSIKMSPEAQDEYEFRELEALREQLDRQYEDADNPNHPFIVAKIEQRIATVQKNINKNAAPMRRPGETYWDDLGFDYFVVDEAHRYKGVGFRSKEAGGDPASIRGVDLHQKTTDLHRRRKGRATITLATGTPLSNSISEQFTMLQFAAPWVLDAYKAGAPDLWANTFGRKTLRIENAPDGSGLRVVERFSEFHNKRAMKTMWGLVADTKRGDDVGIPRPKVKGGAPNLIMVDATPDQKKRLKGLVARGRAIHNGEVDRHEDNMLAVSNEGTSVALDPRLIDANAPAGNKLKAVADRHIERYHANKDRLYPVALDSLVNHPVPGALQMIFLNEGVPGGKNKGNFDAYAELKRLMVAGGIPEDKIAFVQDAKKSGKPEDMTELFRKAREGEIAVLIGSSAVAGTGMNAQDRMISLSHVDLDWGAAQMEQRNGRILRYGNLNPEVEIDIYATKGSMDGWKAGFVATKAEGLVDIQRPEPEDGDSSDVVQEIDGAEFDYETMEAEIGGNPYMSQLMKARRRLKDLEIDQHNEAAERVRRAEALDELREEAQATRDGIQRREQALPRIQEAGDQFRMTLGGSPYSKHSDAGMALHRQITSRLLDHDREGLSDWQLLGQFRGLDFGVRTEKTADGKLVAHVGFPDLRHSDFERTVEDLAKKGAGSGMITRLGNALDKAPALQDSDRAKVPDLDEQIALLQSAHAAADLTPQIDHARKRSNLLEEIVARITALDAKPEIDPDELDKKKIKKDAREAIAKDRRDKREPLQAAVDQAVADLAQWDEENPAPEQENTVRLSEDEVREALARVRPEPAKTSETTSPESNTDDESEGDTDPDGGSPDADETEAPETGSTGDDEPPADVPSTGDLGDDEDDDQGDDDVPEDAGTVRLSPDQVSAQLDAVRPEGSKAPSSMTNDEIRDEIVELMGREMANGGELSGVDRTRLQVLEAEEARRAGRAPKREETQKPKQTSEDPGGLFDVDQPATRQADSAPDVNNPEDRLADAFGTPDMIADAEGRDTGDLRPARMRNAADLEAGDRYTDADGHTHTVVEPPVKTPRGRTRIVTDDGEERFYNADAEVRLRYPDEAIPENDTDEPDAPETDERNDIASAFMREQLAAVDWAETEKVAPAALDVGDLIEVNGFEDSWKPVNFGDVPKRRREHGYVVGEPRRGTIDPGGKGVMTGWRVTVSKTPFTTPGSGSDGRVTLFIRDNDKGVPRFARAEDTGLPVNEIVRADRPDPIEGIVADHIAQVRREGGKEKDDYVGTRPENLVSAYRQNEERRKLTPAVSDAPEAQLVDVDQLEVGDHVRVITQYPSGRQVTKEGYLLDRPYLGVHARDGKTYPGHRMQLGDSPDESPKDYKHGVTVLLGDKVARLPQEEASEAETRDETSSDDERDGRSKRDLDGAAPDETSGDGGAPGTDTDRGDDGNGSDEESQEETDEQRRQNRDGDGTVPDGPPAGAGAGDSGIPGAPADDEDDSDDSTDKPENTDDDQDHEDEEDDRNRRRRRRRRRGNGGRGGPGGLGGPGLPHLNLPNTNTPSPSGAGDGRDGRDWDRTPAVRHRDVDSLRRAWRSGDGLTLAEDTPQRRAALARAAEREGLALSPGGGLVTWPEPQDDGTTLWHFAQARNGNNLPGLSLATDNPGEAVALAGRFEEITGPDGQPFDWHQPWGPSTVRQWRDAEGRNLQRALHAARDDFQAQRAAANTVPDRAPLPDDLTGLDDDELANAWNNDLSPEDQMRLMAEMDRRDGYTDQRVRSVLPDTPPANADEAEQRAKAIDEALGFNNTDVPERRRTREEIIQEEFARFDEARYQQAIDATNGYFYKRKYKDDGNVPNERELFSGGHWSRFGRWREYASEELQNWYDANGGRITYNQFKQQYRDKERVDREQWETEQREQAEAQQPEETTAQAPHGDTDTTGTPEMGGPQPPRFSNVNEVRERWRRGELDTPSHPTAIPKQQFHDGYADNPTLEMSEGGRLVILHHAAKDPGASWDVLAPGSMEPVARAYSRDDALAYARVMESIHDADSRAFPWDAPDAAERALTFRGQDGDTLGEAVARQITERGDAEGLSPRWQEPARLYLDQEGDLDGYYDSWRAQQEADGYTIPVDVNDAQPGDDITTLGVGHFDRPVTQRGTLSEPLRAQHMNRTGTWPFTIGTDYGARLERRAVVTDPARKKDQTRETPFHSFFFRNTPDRPTAFRRPRPGEETQQRENGRAETPQPEAPNPEAPAARPEPTPGRAPVRPEPAAPSAPADEPEGEPEPIDGQPAHWARVSDLVPGDMVRMDGRTRGGRKVTRSGYVFTGPVDVEVTRNNRTQRMWQTYVTENPDGSGKRGHVFTPKTATAARAQAPDDVVPGSPASGAQSAVQTGNLPDVVPADRNGRGLFPGSTITGVDGLRTREGTVTSATSTTVSVRWDNNDTADGLSPNTLTVTGGDRPDGWTASGQRVTPRHIVTDTDGALLGPVDEVDGDRVTITTAEGRITRSAGDLRVTGEVRDDVPDTDPVTGVDEPTAADLKDDDVVVLDLDGRLTTVAVTGISRDGDRVTIDFADTTTGEMGQINVDASTVLPRAQGPDGAPPEIGPDDAPEAHEDLTVHQPPQRVEPVTGPTVDPELTTGDRDVIGDHAAGPDDDPNAHQAAVRITADLPITPEQASALAAQLRASADPSTWEGRAALRAADHLDQSAGGAPPAGLNRPRLANAAQLAEGDTVAMPDERRGDAIHAFRVIDVEDGPGGVRSFLLEDEDQQWRRRVVHGAMPVWLLPEARPDAPTPPDPDDETPAAPAAPSTPTAPTAPAAPVARVRPGSLRVGDVIDAPVSRAGYQFNGHRRLTIISAPQRNGWWMQLTGVDDDGNVHDFGLHSGRDVNVYERNRPTPALPPSGGLRDPNPAPQSDVDRIVADHPRTVAARLIDAAIAGTEPPGGIHTLREQIAQRLTAEALRDARQAARQEAADALDVAGITGRDRAAALQALKRARQDAHTATVRAALRTINDLEPLPDESDEDLAARARDLLSLIPDQIGGRPNQPDTDGDADIARTVAGHTDDAVNAILQQLQAAGVDPGDADRIARILAGQMDGSRQDTARRIARRVNAVSPEAGRQPGLFARIVAALVRLAKRLAALVRAGARKIAEKWRGARERMRRLRAFLGRLVRRVRDWPESRRLTRLHRALDLPAADGESLAARVSHWAGLLPEPGRFGQSQRRVSWWNPTTWGQLAAGRLPGRRDRIQWSPDTAADGGPGLTALRHMAALRAAGSDVDQDVTRRLSGALGDDFGGDPHGTLHRADDYVALTEQRLVNLQAARSGGTIPDDEELELEITAARAEASAARREWADLRAQYAAAVPDAVAAALAEVRDIGPEGNVGIVFGPDSTPDAERSVRGVQRLVPRSWLNTPAARRVTAVDGDEGRYEPDGQRITVADLADDGLGTAGHGLAQHLAQHLGDLDAAQRVFWFTQTHTGRPGARRMRPPSALSRLLRRQQTQPDTGDTLARSVQSMFSGDWYMDDDLRAFLLGLLATR
ncbi:SNF2-related protein [Streptomyces tendae]|uniref:SNF2-related protein n=1 Tax=Streptomyces tendae TaxID=1932 RepID=UPI0036B72467